MCKKSIIAIAISLYATISFAQTGVDRSYLREGQTIRDLSNQMGARETQIYEQNLRDTGFYDKRLRGEAYFKEDTRLKQEAIAQVQNEQARLNQEYSQKLARETAEIEKKYSQAYRPDSFKDFTQIGFPVGNESSDDYLEILRESSRALKDYHGFDMNRDKYIVMTEGSQEDIEKLFKLLKKPAGAGQKTAVILGVDFESDRPLKKGVKGATSVLNFLATNPDLLKALQKQGVVFSVYDKSRGVYDPFIDNYFKHESWKLKKAGLTNAEREVRSQAFQEKLNTLATLEKSLDSKGVNQSDVRAQIRALRAEIALVSGKAYAKAIVEDAILNVPKSAVAGSPLELFANKVSRSIAQRVQVSEQADAGRKVSPKAAAKASVRGAK